jgi:hypothetical protein
VHHVKILPCSIQMNNNWIVGKKFIGDHSAVHPYLHNRVVHRRRGDWSWDLRGCRYCDLLDYTTLLVIMRRKIILNICSSVLARNLSDQFRLETCHCNPFSHHYTDSCSVMPVNLYACTRIYDATGFHGEAMQVRPYQDMALARVVAYGRDVQKWARM